MTDKRWGYGAARRGGFYDLSEYVEATLLDAGIDVGEVAAAVGLVLRDAFYGGGSVAPDIEWMAVECAALAEATDRLVYALRMYQGPGEHTNQRWRAWDFAGTAARHLAGAAHDLGSLLASEDT